MNERTFVPPAIGDSEVLTTRVGGDFDAFLFGLGNGVVCLGTAGFEELQCHSVRNIVLGHDVCRR